MSQWGTFRVDGNANSVVVGIDDVCPFTFWYKGLGEDMITEGSVLIDDRGWVLRREDGNTFYANSAKVLGNQTELCLPIVNLAQNFKDFVAGNANAATDLLTSQSAGVLISNTADNQDYGNLVSLTDYANTH